MAKAEKTIVCVRENKVTIWRVDVNTSVCSSV